MGLDIFAYIFHKMMENVGKYVQSHSAHMGNVVFVYTDFLGICLETPSSQVHEEMIPNGRVGKKKRHQAESFLPPVTALLDEINVGV